MTLFKSFCFAALLTLAAIPVDAAQTAADQQLIERCAARTDARMDSMTLRKLEQLRNFEFSLRMAMSQVIGGEQSMPASDWQKARANLQRARAQLAQACEVAMPAQG